MQPPNYLEFSKTSLKEWVDQCASANIAISASESSYSEGEHTVTPLDISDGFSEPIAVQMSEQTLRLIWMNSGSRASITYMLTGGLFGWAEPKEEGHKRDKEQERIIAQLKSLPSFVGYGCDSTGLWGSKPQKT
jgi:hypothetical protein